MTILHNRTICIVMSFVCVWFLIWRKSKNINYEDRNVASPQEQRNQSLSMHSTNSMSYSNSDKSSRNLSANPNAFEPEVIEDIQTVQTEIPRIPHIMHFIFITGLKSKHGIPSIYRNNVMSFLRFNPNWTYYFWSDISARELIATRQPALLSTYDNYTRVILKADALRYVLLFEFGGVYADLDLQCMRPLARATMKYACILTPEAFEHSAILYKLPYVFSNAFMLCRPKHPFFKQVIDSLPTTAYLKNITDVTGSMFITKQYRLYNKIQPNEIFRIKPSVESNTPYFYQGELEEDHNDATYVANTQYFMSSFDSRHNVRFRTICTKYSSKYIIVKRGCILWNKRKNNETKNSFSYTDHRWNHMYSIRHTTKMIPIQSVIPQIKQYNASFKIPV